MSLTAAEIMDESALLLNDSAKITFTYTVQTGWLKRAINEFSDELAVNSIKLLNRIQVVAPVISTTTTIPLPTDCLIPIKLEERALGSSDDFTYMYEVDSISPNLSPQVSFRFWTFAGTLLNSVPVISVPNASTTREVRVTYERFLPYAGVDASTDFSTSLTINSKRFLASKTAEFITRFVLQNDKRATELKDESAKSLYRLIQIWVRKNQSIPIRRSRFSQPSDATAFNLPLATTGGGTGSSPATTSTDLGWIDPCNFPYLCKGDGTTDDSIPLQAAIDAATCIFLRSGKSFNIGTTTINLHAGLTILGADYTSSKILYAGTSSALRYTNPAVNSSGYGRILLRDFAISTANGANVGAAIDFKAGGYAFFHVDHVYIGGSFKYGIVLDQAEVSTISRCIIENTGPASSANIWITNGDEWRAGAGLGFSNVIAIKDNQINGGVYGIADDGGNNRTIVGNNLNGNGIAYRVAGLSGLIFNGNSLENTVATDIANVLFTDTSIVGGGGTPNKGTCKGFAINSNTFSMNVTGSNAMLSFQTASVITWHQGGVVFGNRFDFKLGRGTAIDVTQLRWSQCAFNYDAASNASFHYGGIHDDANGNVLFTPGDSAEADVWRFGRTDIPTMVGQLQVGAQQAGICILTYIHTSAVAAWNPPNLADGAVATTTLAISNALLGDICMATLDSIGDNAVLLSAHVTVNGTARVTLMNKTGGALDIPNGNLRIVALRFA